MKNSRTLVYVLLFFPKITAPFTTTTFGSIGATKGCEGKALLIVFVSIAELARFPKTIILTDPTFDSLELSKQSFNNFFHVCSNL